MPIVQTGLAQSIDASKDRAKLDSVAKKLVKHKIILAEILKECVEEFRDYEVKYIEQNCIVGDVRVDEISVDQDVLDADTSIVGLNTEDTSEREGTVRFDLVFEARVPSTEEIIGLIINVEIQGDMEPGYPLISRAIYYLARLISRQKGTIFTNSDYGKIRKVYSIWICLDPRRVKANSIVEYGFTQTKVIGKVNEEQKNYDKMKAIIISLNDDGIENRNDIIRLLSTLLSTTETVEKRKEILENEFNIPMTEEMVEEVQNMCNLGRAIEQAGIERGFERGSENSRLQDISNLMDSMKWSAQQAMDALKIPSTDREKYAAKLNN